MRALRTALPDHEMVVALPRPLSPLVQLAGVADLVHPTVGLEPLVWERPPPDVAVNLHGRGPESHRLLQRVSPGRLLAFDSPAAVVDGPTWDPEEHEVIRWCRLVSDSFGVAADPGDRMLEEPSTPAAIRGAVVIHPGAAYPARRWPVERFAAVARWAGEAGYDVAVTGSPDEAPLGERVIELAGLPSRSMLAGTTSLLELAAVVANARVVVCGDTGVAHLASAYRTPSVVLFGPTPPARWGPPEDGPHSVLWRGGPPGDPWADSPDPRLLDIGVDEVVERTRARAVRPAPAGI